MHKVHVAPVDLTWQATTHGLFSMDALKWVDAFAFQEKNRTQCNPRQLKAFDGFRLDAVAI